MKKYIKYMISGIRMISGLFLLLLVAMFWLLGIIFASIVSIVTWFEKNLANAMKKCMGEEEL
jgi:hypothetical protein|tara:strand:- start:467 stop:652 length:186 start_codon:yes stop_codon:yes gene_type:complete